MDAHPNFSMTHFWMSDLGFGGDGTSFLQHRGKPSSSLESKRQRYVYRASEHKEQRGETTLVLPW